MTSLGNIYQSIEILSKEKGIDPQIIRDAVKDAMLVAARKFRWRRRTSTIPRSKSGEKSASPNPWMRWDESRRKPSSR